MTLNITKKKIEKVLELFNHPHTRKIRKNRGKKRRRNNKSFNRKNGRKNLATSTLKKRGGHPIFNGGFGPVLGGQVGGTGDDLNIVAQKSIEIQYILENIKKEINDDTKFDNIKQNILKHDISDNILEKLDDKNFKTMINDITFAEYKEYENNFKQNTITTVDNIFNTAKNRFQSGGNPDDNKYRIIAEILKEKIKEKEKREEEKIKEKEKETNIEAGEVKEKREEEKETNIEAGEGKGDENETNIEEETFNKIINESGYEDKKIFYIGDDLAHAKNNIINFFAEKYPKYNSDSVKKLLTNTFLTKLRKKNKNQANKTITIHKVESKNDKMMKLLTLREDYTIFNILNNLLPPKEEGQTADLKEIVKKLDFGKFVDEIGILKNDEEESTINEGEGKGKGEGKREGDGDGDGDGDNEEGEK